MGILFGGHLIRRRRVRPNTHRKEDKTSSGPHRSVEYQGATLAGGQTLTFGGYLAAGQARPRMLASRADNVDGSYGSMLLKKLAACGRRATIESWWHFS